MRNLLSILYVLFASAIVAHATCVFAQTTSGQTDGQISSDAAIGRAVTGVISYTRWPAPLSSVRLCVVGEVHDWRSGTTATSLPSDPPISVRPMAVSDEGLPTTCDALYLGALSEGDRRLLYQRIADHPFLTITEQDRSCTSGAMFCIDASDTRVRFDVNIDSVSRSGVHVSPKVLELARKLNTP